jgi:hypothetical protein
VIHIITPHHGFFSSKVELMVVKEYAKGLNPGEITLDRWVMIPDKVCIDMMVRIRDDTEILVLAAVKTRNVTTYIAWFLAP